MSQLTRRRKPGHEPGQRVRSRFVKAGSDTPFRVALGGQRMALTHGDGFPVVPVPTDALTDVDRTPDPPVTQTTMTGPLAVVWNAVTAVIATIMGLAPHVLHHIGLFAGAALVVGVAGNLLFGTVGLLLSIPLLRRLHRRFGTWRAPALAVVVFAVTFSISAFVIGPAISSPRPADAPQPVGIPSPAEHSAHHDD